MAYCDCPHCGSSLFIVVEWATVRCPFCGGELHFPDYVVMDIISLEKTAEPLKKR